VDTSVGGRRAVRVPDDSGLVTEMVVIPPTANDHLNNYQWHDTLFWTRLLTFALRWEASACSSISIRPASWRHHDFHKLGEFLDGHAFVVNFAVPGRIDPDRGFRNLSTAFVQDDYRWKPNLTLNLG